MFECPDCGREFKSKHGMNSHRQKHNKPRTCEICGRDDIKLMPRHLKKWCPGPPPDYEPHIEVDLREWEGLAHRVQELEGQLAEAHEAIAERDEKIAAMGRTAAKRNSRIKSLEAKVSKASKQ